MDFKFSINRFEFITGLIMLVIILVSLFPLPLDKFRMWFSSKSSSTERPGKVLPCIDLNVTEIWTYSLPKLTSESTMRALDVNLDGVEDIVFGFGIGIYISSGIFVYHIVPQLFVYFYSNTSCYTHLKLLYSCVFYHIRIVLHGR